MSESLHEVYLSPSHGTDLAEIELTLFDIDARSWLNAIVLRPGSWLTRKNERLQTYRYQDRDVIGVLMPFGNATAVKLRTSFSIARVSRAPSELLEDLYYSSCGRYLLRIQMRSRVEDFEHLGTSAFKAFKDKFICEARE